MNKEKQETIADILAEMRDFANGQEKNHCYDLRLMGTDSLRAYADRIEEAAKREGRTIEKSSVVGNAAAMRKALAMLLDACASFYESIENGLDGHYEAILDYDSAVGDFLRRVDTAKCALSAPPRNCDKFKNIKEAKIRYCAEVEKVLIWDGYNSEKLIKWIFKEAKGETKWTT